MQITISIYSTIIIEQCQAELKHNYTLAPKTWFQWSYFEIQSTIYLAFTWKYWNYGASLIDGGTVFQWFGGCKGDLRMTVQSHFVVPQVLRFDWTMTNMEIVKLNRCGETSVEVFCLRLLVIICLIHVTRTQSQTDMFGFHSQLRTHRKGVFFLSPQRWKLRPVHNNYTE